jgi:hypothetical protein
MTNEGLSDRVSSTRDFHLYVTKISDLSIRPSDLSFLTNLLTLYSAGPHGGGGLIYGPGRRKEAIEAAGDHFGRTPGQAQQWPDARPQNRKCQQVVSIPAYQGETLARGLIKGAPRDGTALRFLERVTLKVSSVVVLFGLQIRFPGDKSYQFTPAITPISTDKEIKKSL